jgi:hypothetical protein
MWNIDRLVKNEEEMRVHLALPNNFNCHLSKHVFIAPILLLLYCLSSAYESR